MTGVSLMLLDEGMDTGPVIAQREYSLNGEETAGPLTDALFLQGSALLRECLEPWVRGELEARPQDDSGATVSSKLERTDGEADWTLRAESLARQCRAFSPWPGLFTVWEGRTLKLVSVSVASEAGKGSAVPGTVVPLDSGKGLAVATAHGMLALDRVQLEGKRAVSGEEFLRGYPEIRGARLASKGQADSAGD